MGQRTQVEEREALIGGYDGAQVPVFVAEPPGRPGAPRVVVVPEISGLSPWVRATVRRLAREGFRAVAVEPFSRDPLPEGRSVPELVARVGRLRFPGLLSDLRAGLALLGGPGKEGVIGFCLGGSVALLLAGDGQPLDAAVSCYGRLRLTQHGVEAPVEAARRSPCPILGIYGEEDRSIPLETLAELRAAAPPGSEVALYKAGHAFLDDTRPELFAPQQAELAWAKITGFLRRNLD